MRSFNAWWWFGSQYNIMRQLPWHLSIADGKKRPAITDWIMIISFSWKFYKAQNTECIVRSVYLKKSYDLIFIYRTDSTLYQYYEMALVLLRKEQNRHDDSMSLMKRDAIEKANFIYNLPTLPYQTFFHIHSRFNAHIFRHNMNDASISCHNSQQSS